MYDFEVLRIYFEVFNYEDVAIGFIFRHSELSTSKKTVTMIY
jgi:hypothetical protein